MKHILLFIYFSISLATAKSQNLNPVETNEYCPNIEYTFTASLPKPFSSMIGEGGCYVTQNPSGIGSTSITFKGKFGDANQKQIFRIYYSDNSSYGFEFKKIKSLFYSSCLPIQPNTYSILAPRCEISNFPISFSNVQYTTAFESPIMCFGTISNYEYLLPANWKIGATVSNGSTWIEGGNNVTVTSDLNTGTATGSGIRIRPTNSSCGAGLAKGAEVFIAISRPAPSLNITPLTPSICGTGSTELTLSGTPAGATVTWSISSTTQASITQSPINQNKATVTRIGTANTTVTATATVTHCSFTYTATRNIALGTIPITIQPYTPICSTQVFTLCATPIVNAASHYWVARVLDQDVTLDETGNWCVEVPENTLYVDLFVTNECGVTIKKRQFIQYSECASRMAQSLITVSPNPAKNSIHVKSKSGKGYSFNEIIVVDKFNHVLKHIKYPTSSTNASINISHLPTDIYYIKTFNGTDWQTVSVSKM